MARTSTLALALALGLIAGPATAECLHNGEAVAEGTRVGGLVCEAGEWVEDGGGAAD